MKIFKTQPEESTQWKADAPSVKAMRMIMPIAAILSAVSLAGGIASFLNVGLTTTAGICIVAAFAVAAYFFDKTAVSEGQSVVRNLILVWKDQRAANLTFIIGVVTASIICAAMVFGSFIMSRNGISYLVLEVRKAKEIRTATDTTLTATIAGATDQNSGTLAAIRQANEAQQAAINATYAGKVESLEAEIQRREKQRNSENYQYIDQRIARLKKQIGEAKAEQGAELAALAASFAAEQARILSGNEKLQSIVLDDAKSAADRRKIQQAEKDEADRALSGLVAAIFSWSVVLLLVIGLRLTMLETDNGILPQPVTTNSDLSGMTMIIRPVLAVPYFALACVNWLSEQLYRLAPKKPIPTIDDDLVTFEEGQAKVVPIRKEAKQQRPAPYREIGYKRPGIAANFDGKNGGEMTASGTGAITANNRPVSTAPENGENIPVNDGNSGPEKEVIIQRVDSMVRDCVECGTTYRAKAHNQKFCSRTCKTNHHTNRNGGREFDPAKFHGKKF